MKNKKTYSELLRDPRWQKKRLEIFNRDNFTCIFCGDNTKELQVHHTVYNGEPWSVPSETLQTVCSDCHKAIELVKKYNRQINSIEHTESNTGYPVTTVNISGGVVILNFEDGLILPIFSNHG